MPRDNLPPETIRPETIYPRQYASWRQSATWRQPATRANLPTIHSANLTKCHHTTNAARGNMRLGKICYHYKICHQGKHANTDNMLPKTGTTKGKIQPYSNLNCIPCKPSPQICAVSFVESDISSDDLFMHSK